MKARALALRSLALRSLALRSLAHRIAKRWPRRLQTSSLALGLNQGEEQRKAAHTSSTRSLARSSSFKHLRT
eukprot:3065272-Rhodomonas_salina.1